MTDRDLTPAEARAEVEAFMGEGWMCDGAVHHDGDAIVWAHRAGCHQYGMAPTFRAAVDALKSAWRDAVRPWCAPRTRADGRAPTAGGDRDGVAPDQRDEVQAAVNFAIVEQEGA